MGTKLTSPLLKNQEYEVKLLYLNLKFELTSICCINIQVLNSFSICLNKIYKAKHTKPITTENNECLVSKVRNPNTTLLNFLGF